MSRRRRVALGELSGVLVADADAGAGEVLTRHFVRRGFRASYTSLGREVLGLAAAGQVRVAIVDVALADMSGHTLVSRLKEIDPSLRVLMTTADYRPELELRARQIGIVHYAQKPVDCGRLEAVVARALAS